MSSDRSQGGTFIREVTLRYSGAHRKTEESTADFARRLLQGDAREHFIAIYLESRHLVIAYSAVSVGTANQSLVHPREVLQPHELAGTLACMDLRA